MDHNEDRVAQMKILQPTLTAARYVLEKQEKNTEICLVWNYYAMANCTAENH